MNQLKISETNMQKLETVKNEFHVVKPIEKKKVVKTPTIVIKDAVFKVYDGKEDNCEYIHIRVHHEDIIALKPELINVNKLAMKFYNDENDPDYIMFRLKSANRSLGIPLDTKYEGILYLQVYDFEVNADGQKIEGQTLKVVNHKITSEVVEVYEI